MMQYTETQSQLNSQPANLDSLDWSSSMDVDLKHLPQILNGNEIWILPGATPGSQVFKSLKRFMTNFEVDDDLGYLPERPSIGLN